MDEGGEAIRGEVIFEEDEQGDGLYFLTDGVVKLSKAYLAGKETTLMCSTRLLR